MTPPAQPAGAAARPTVDDAKRQLSAWGDATEERVAILRSRVISGAASLAIGAGITGLVVLAVRRLLTKRVTATDVTVDHADVPGAGTVSDAGAPRTRRSSLGRWISWMIVTRAGRLLLPHVVRAVRQSVGGTKAAAVAQESPRRDR